MRDVVVDAWLPFNKDLEGWVRHLYVDQIGLVSSGMGNLLDPIALAIGLPWRNADGTLATREEIARAWHRVKRDAIPGSGGGNQGRFTSIRLDEADVKDLVSRKLREVDGQLGRLFPSWEAWPPDAQLALASWAWAAGAGAKYPKMIAALRRLDFRTAADEVDVWIINKAGEKSLTKELKQRNEWNRRCLLNAAAVVEANMPLDVLHWPATVTMPEEVA